MHDSVEQLGPPNTDILLSHAAAQRFAVMIWPFPGITYQTPDMVCETLQNPFSPVPLFVASMVVPDIV